MSQHPTASAQLPPHRQHSTHTNNTTAEQVKQGSTHASCPHAVWPRKIWRGSTMRWLLICCLPKLSSLFRKELYFRMALVQTRPENLGEIVANPVFCPYAHACTCSKYPQRQIMHFEHGYRHRAEQISQDDEAVRCNTHPTHLTGRRITPSQACESPKC